MSATVARKSVPLDAEDLAALADIRTRDTALHDAMAQLIGEAGLAQPSSESAALHALLVLGLRCVEQRAELTGYAAYAASLDDEDHAAARALRNRRRVARDFD